MSRIPDDLAIRYGAILDEFEGALKTLNSSKSSTLEDLRADLRKLGMVGAEISAEIGMLKGAVKLSRMTETERQKSSEKDDGVADYVNILALARARAHVRGDEHDAETGEVKESTAARKDVRGLSTDATQGSSLPVVARNLEATSGSPGEPNQTAGTQAPPVDTIIEPEAAMLPQTTGSETAVASSPSVDAAASPGKDGVATSSAGTEGEVDRQPIHEPVAIPPVDPSSTVATEAGDRSAVPPPSAAPVVASNVTAFRTHNPDTHFLNSKGLPRLHGCLKPEACGGSHRAICFSCSVRHEGPAFQGGVA